MVKVFRFDAKSLRCYGSKELRIHRIHQELVSVSTQAAKMAKQVASALQSSTGPKRENMSWRESLGRIDTYYLVVHPTNRKWVSSPQLEVDDLPPLIPLKSPG